MNDDKIKQNVVGINNARLDKAVLDIYDYAQKINNTLDNIELVINNTSGYYCCKSADKYRQRFLKLKSNFAIINKNTISYAEDLVVAKKVFTNNQDVLADHIKNNQAKLETIKLDWE